MSKDLTNAQREAQWRAEMDASTLMAAQEIVGDKTRLTAAQALANKIANKASGVANLKPSTRAKSNPAPRTRGRK